MGTTVPTETAWSETKSRPRRFRGLAWQETMAGYMFALPALVGLTIFLILPILASFALIFMKYDLLSPPEWVGLENIKRLFTDKRMFEIYWNSVKLVVGATFFNNLLGLLLAMGVNRAMPATLRYFLRTSIFFPV